MFTGGALTQYIVGKPVKAGELGDTPEPTLSDADFERYRSLGGRPDVLDPRPFEPYGPPTPGTFVPTKPKWTGPAQIYKPETYTEYKGRAADIGLSDDDVVRIVIYPSSGKKEVLHCETWSIEETIFSQPSRWAATVGYGGVIGDLTKEFQPNTKYELWIGASLQSTGTIDGYEVEQVGNGTRMQIHGRDILAPIHDSFVDAELDFSNDTYASMIGRVMKRLGMDTTKLITSKVTDRQIKAGVPLDQITDPAIVDEIKDEKVAKITISSGGSRQASKLKTTLGDRWHDFIRKHLDRAGLFMWASADGQIILAAPNVRQPSSYKIVRQRDNQTNAVNVTRARFVFDTISRHSEVAVYQRNTKKKFGGSKLKGAFVDDEMQSLGFKQTLVIRDADVQNEEQAKMLARRKIAEERRKGFQLEYTIAGHRLPVLVGGKMTGKLGIVVTDTIIDVDDEELAIRGRFYVDSLRRTRSPHTQTVIRLCRVSDMFFLDGSDAIVEYRPVPGGGVGGKEMLAVDSLISKGDKGLRADRSEREAAVGISRTYSPNVYEIKRF